MTPEGNTQTTCEDDDALSLIEIGACIQHIYTSPNNTIDAVVIVFPEDYQKLSRGRL